MGMVNSQSSKKQGRPSLEDLLAMLDAELEILRGSLPAIPQSVDQDAVLRELWLDDTHESTAIEGNTLSRAQVEDILETRRVGAQTSLAEALDVEGYARAAAWAYMHASKHKGVPVRVVSEIHRLAMHLLWEIDPPRTRDRPGTWRAGGVRVGSLRVSIPAAIQADLDEWSRSTRSVKQHPVVHASTHHAWLERIHPFVDGNGRVGRLVMNFMLIQLGVPPVAIPVGLRQRYLGALRAADKGNVNQLSTIIARSAREAVGRFLVSSLKGERRLVPLSTLAEKSPYSSVYLRQLVLSGRLRAVRQGRLHLSSKEWLDEYIENRDPRGIGPTGPP